MTERKEKLNMNELDADAKQKAIKHLKDMFQSPGQLEKTEHYKMTLIRKKPSVEGFFRLSFGSEPCMQSQKTLERCLKEAQEIEQCLKHAVEVLPEIENLCSKLNELREENMRHSQYATARENLRHIFTVPESVSKAEQWINEGKLLHTHQCLRDLENARDALLYELHRLPNQSVYDKNMLSACFKDVEVLSNNLEKQLVLILGRTLNTVRKEPTVIVSALRIIEREEEADKESFQYQKASFKRPGRPKRWKELAFKVLENAVATRIEGTQVDEREDNKMWLVRYLELTRQLILEDLRVVKTLCVPCFPPKYKIVDAYVRMYHNCLRKYLQEVIQNGLEGNEFVSLLSWTLNTYKSEDLIGHPDLKEYTDNLEALLSDEVLKSLKEQYLRNMENDYANWLKNVINQEKQDWMSTTAPSVDSIPRSTVPVIIYEMICQVLSVAQTINQEVTSEAFIVSIQQIINFGRWYKEAVVDYKNKLVEDRNQVLHFTFHMVTIVNNSKEIISIWGQLQKQYWKQNPTHKLNEAMKNLKDFFTELRNESGKYLLEEVFMDISKHFDDLFTQRWFGDSRHVDTICLTLEDYFHDYDRLTEENLKFIINEAKTLVAKRYVTSMLSKKISFKTYEECQKAAAQVNKEVQQMQRVFLEIAPELSDEDDVFKCIKALAEVLKSEDDMISFELHRIVEQYSNITEDHLLRLLYCRGDLNKSELKEKVNFVTKSVKPKIYKKNVIFDELKFTTLLGKLNL